MTPLRRYTLYQIPGIIAVVVAVALAWRWIGLPHWVGAVLIAGWIAKDIALYPMLKTAYRSADSADPAGLVGRQAMVIDALAPQGHVRIGAERWRARVQAGGCEVPPGRQVRIESVEGLTLIVDLADTLPDE
jgi:membrane protein implicated in regulation of membrane protease activity